jgi:hypothetical protein
MAEQVSTGEKVQAHTGAMLDETRARAGETVRRVAKEGGGFIDSQKRLAAVEVDGYACALHETARQLHDQQQDAVADYAERVASSLDSLAHNLRDKDMGEVIDNIGDFARRQPGVFITGAVAMGFLLSRFMKSSESDVGYSTGEMKEDIQERGEPEVKAEPAMTTEAEMKGEPSGTEHPEGEPYTSADVEIPVILKPHEPIRPEERHP